MTMKQQKNFVPKVLLLMPKPLKEKVAELIFVALSTVTKTITYRTYQPFKQIIFHKKIHPVFNAW